MLYWWSDGLERDLPFKKEDSPLRLVVQKTCGEQGWMYTIYDQNQLLVQQEILPVLRGKHKIPSKEVAERLGAIVLKKIHNKQIPVVSEAELRAIVPLLSSKDSIL